jgi:hypothetical protein
VNDLRCAPRTIDAPRTMDEEEKGSGYCDYCGTFFRGGTMRRGTYKFCNGSCFERGQVLEILDHVAPADVDAQIEAMRSQSCPICRGRGPLDIHHSHTVCSIVVYTWWRTTAHFCCRACARKEQNKALAVCLLTGWWGFPWGVFVTPWQIIRNVSGLIRSADQPSRDLKRIVRLDFAKYLVAARARTRPAAAVRL